MVRVFFTFHWPFRTEQLCRINFGTEAFWKQQEGAMGWSSHRWVCTAKWLKSKNKQKYIITVISQTAIRKRKLLYKWSLSYYQNRPNQRRLWCIFWVVPERKPFLQHFFLRSHAAEPVSGVSVQKYGTFSIPYIKYLPLNFISGFSKNRRNQDGGRRRVDCCGSHRWFKGLFSESCFFIIRRCELELYKYCESYT